jgi:parvulin-like peptidyl-prolyl isomerase
VKSKLKKLNVHPIKRIKARRMTPVEKEAAAIEAAPRITNETVAAHREEVLSSARKYIYPLQHSKHKVVIISASLFVALTVIFFTYCTLALYRFHSTSTFIYRVTQVIPFPVARANKRMVSYESYLFELRHYIHYYESQQQTDFSDPKNEPQLTAFKKRALQTVVDNAYIKDLASQNKVSVSDRELEQQIEIVRSQNRLGGSESVFEDVLKDFWGWSVSDFKRSLRQQMLTQKVVAELDVQTKARAQAAYSQLQTGADFATLVKTIADNDQTTKDRGGEYDALIDRTNPDLAAQTTEALFKLQANQFSEVINTGYTLEIVKVLEIQADKIRAAHMSFNLKDVETFIKDLKDERKPRQFITP